MNPFSRYLRQWNEDKGLEVFVSYWDRLERVMVAVYRQKCTPAEAEGEFGVVWAWLRQEYPRWQEVLRPYWQSTWAAGEPTQVDPFQLLLDLPTVQAIGGDWNRMQQLPAAREALNCYLLAQD